VYNFTVGAAGFLPQATLLPKTAGLLSGWRSRGYKNFPRQLKIPQLFPLLFLPQKELTAIFFVL